MNTKTETIGSCDAQRGHSEVSWRHFLKMTKPTISLLVVVTSVPGMLLVGSNLPSLIVVFATFAGIWLTSGSAAVFNQIIDFRIDTAMARTRGRPLPSGNVPTWMAALFGMLIGVMGTGILCGYGTPLAAGIALAANLFYVLFYTAFLKMRTDQNIVIGGAAGAVGPLIGAAMINGQGMAWGAVVLAAIIFLWTPPHFWALAIKYRDDYARAKVPMYPVTRGFPATRSAIFIYTLTLLPAVGLLWFTCGISLVGLVLSLGLTTQFCWYAWRLYRSQDNKLAMPVFHYSCLYLFMLFGVVSVDLLVALL